MILSQIISCLLYTSELGSTRIKAVLVDETNAPIASGAHDWENQLVDGIWTYLSLIHIFPVRIELGPKDIEAGVAVIVRRDTREKITANIDELAEKVAEVLETEQHDMLERARTHRENHTYDAVTKEEFKQIADEKPGFIRAMWCLSLIHI